MVFDMTSINHPEHPQDRAAMLASRLMLKSMKGSVDGPGSRKAFDDMMEKVPAAADVTYAAETIGGVAGWWCRPRDATRGSAILYFHGGGYVVGTAKAYRHFVGQIAARANVAAFIPEYRLAPEFAFPAAVEDAQATYAGLLVQGFKNVALSGDSAGGGLALILLSSTTVKARSSSGTAPKGAAVISAWTDLKMTGQSMKTRAEADPLSTPDSLGALANLYLGDRDPRDPQASPLYGDLNGLPPVRMHVGEDDVLLDDSIRYGERFQQQAGTIQVHTWEGMMHVFPSNLALLKAANEALDDIGGFLKTQLHVNIAATSGAPAQATDSPPGN
jgi:epsilon-lactone hydrolase